MLTMVLGSKRTFIRFFFFCFISIILQFFLIMCSHFSSDCLENNTLASSAFIEKAILM